MRLERAAIHYIGFLVCFFGLFAVAFRMEVFPEDSPEFYLAVLVVLISLSMTFLALLGHRVFALGRARAWAMGLLVAGLGYVGVGALEDSLTDQAYLKKNSISDFSRLEGHCGYRIGKTVFLMLDRILNGPGASALHEARIGSWCRIRHLQFLEQRGALLCEPGFDAIECRVRWMTAFSQGGDWGYEAREHFFQSILRVWDRGANAEHLIEYVARDQDLSSLLKSDPEKNTELTFRILERANALVGKPPEGATPEPWYLKLKDLEQEALKQKK